MFKPVLLLCLCLGVPACATQANSGALSLDGISAGMPIWMNGCWVNPDDGAKEVWRAESGGMMFGYAVNKKNGKIVFFEQLRITEGAEGLTYVASPNGEGSTAFKLAGQTDTSVRFINPDHDYPQSIRYELKDKALHATIALADGSNPMSFTKQRCD